MRKVLDMTVDNGKRMWLVAWEGEDPATGRAWSDSYEPTCNVSEDLRIDFLAQARDRPARCISVDVSPLDALVIDMISDTIKAGDGKDSFGHMHVIPIDALSLSDVALSYLNSVSARFSEEVRVEYDPKRKEDVKEVRLMVHQLEEFCEFESTMPRAGTKNLRLRGSAESRTWTSWSWRW